METCKLTVKKRKKRDRETEWKEEKKNTRKQQQQKIKNTNLFILSMKTKQTNKKQQYLSDKLFNDELYLLLH